MAIEQLKVHEIVAQAVSKNVDIPEFQREFIWDPDQVKLLAESLYRNYPIGSLLLWNSSDYQEAKGPQGTQASLWIVDGQQRTTALCLLLGQKPYWWSDAESWNQALERYDVMANLLPDGGEGSLEFALPNPIRRRDPRWISVRRVLAITSIEELTPLAQEIAGKIRPDPAQAMALFPRIHAHLQRLWQIREREIPIIKIRHEVEDVAEIFARLNQAGTRVKEADVILALAAVRNPGWVREEYLPFRNELEERGWDLDAGVFIRTMTGIGRGRARLIEVPKDFWNPENLKTVWVQTKAAMTECLKRLAQYGLFSADLLPSANSLIPLFVLHHRWGTHRGYSFGRSLRWFLRANWDGRYSGSAITSLNEDVRAVMEAKDFDQALESLESRLRVPLELSPEEFLKRYDRAGSRFLRLLLYLMLFHHGAVDWVDQTRLGYDKTGAMITAGFEPQWHHIYPRSVLRKRKEIEEDAIHALANITVLNERTNTNRLRNKEPWRYIREFRISEQDLRKHLIPESFARAVHDEELLKTRWSIDRFKDFLSERAEQLAREANVFLGKLVEESSSSLFSLSSFSSSPAPSPEAHAREKSTLRTPREGQDRWAAAVARLKAIQAHPSEEARRIIEARDEVLMRFRPLFQPDRIFQLNAEDFRDFLRFEHNRHWTNLSRPVRFLLQNLPALREALAILVDEGRPVGERLDEAHERVRGLGKAIATALLLIAYPDRYGVWNNTSEKALKALGLWPTFRRKATLGERYEAVNRVLNQLAEALEVDLWSLDALLWDVRQG